MDYYQAQRLVKELHDIVVNPETHDQTMWVQADEKPIEGSACGTTGCLAGNAVLRAGYPLQWEQGSVWDAASGKYVYKWLAHNCQVDGERVPIRDAAEDLFGLTRSQTEVLFDEKNTVADLWDFAIRYSNGYIRTKDVVGAYEERAARVESDLKAKVRAALGL